MASGLFSRFRKAHVTDVSDQQNATNNATEGDDKPAASTTATDVSSNVEQLAKFKRAHQWDYNLDYDQIEAVNKAEASDDVEKKAAFERVLLEDNSPYFEVRNTVRNYDE